MTIKYKKTKKDIEKKLEEGINFFLNKKKNKN